MNESNRSSRLFSQALPLALPVLIAFFFYFVYRWADPARTQNPSSRPLGSATSTIVLENAPFYGTANGHITWALEAGRIEIERMRGSGLSSISSATLSDIRKGTLYTPSRKPLPSQGITPAADRTMTPSPRPHTAEQTGIALSEITRRAGPIAATFSARQGRYLVGEREPLPADLALAYSLQWQLKLTGGVNFRTKDGDHLQSETLTILELMNRRTRRIERRILCETGAHARFRGTQMQSNLARYDPDERTIECTGGARGTFHNGAVQSERMFWSLRDQQIRCPETTSGTWRGLPFTAEGLNIDLKRRAMHANHIRLQIRMDESGLRH